MMRDKCNKCCYSQAVNVGEEREMLRACVYILMHYEKRPCPPGEDCTVYTPRRGRRYRMGRPLWP